MRRPGSGRPPARPSPGQEAEAVASRRLRAVEEPLDVRLRYREPGLELEVRNPVHRTSYRVFFPAYHSRDAALCTCTDFARRGLGTCKHLEAAWEWLSRLPELPKAPSRPGPSVPTEALWKAVESRVAELGRSPPKEIRDLERAGRALVEPEEATKKRGEEVGRGAGGRDRPTTSSRARS